MNKPFLSRIYNKYSNYNKNSKVIVHASELFKYNLNIFILFISIMGKKECALCGTILHESTSLNLCNKCIGCADCCIGLEKL